MPAALALQQEAQAALGDPAGTAPLRIGVPEDLVNAAMAATFRDFHDAIGKSIWT